MVIGNSRYNAVLRLIFDPHAAKYPGIAQIDNYSLLHVDIAI
jgi:hypothetical protein